MRRGSAVASTSRAGVFAGAYAFWEPGGRLSGSRRYRHACSQDRGRESELAGLNFTG